MTPAALVLCAALLAASCSLASAAETTSRLGIDSRIGDLLGHPAFSGHARLLLPSDDAGIDTQLPLQRIASLLPYHSEVRPRIVVDALNRMIDDASHGQAVFHRFYTEEQQRADPAKASTGLFFFRGRPGAPFAIVAPGGGFTYVGSVHEGFPHALEISRRGYNAFVLRYRVGLGETAATEDMAAAISYLFRNSAALGIATDGYSAWGSSAGARMAANVGSHGLRRFGAGDLPKPSLVVMAYTGHADIAATEPPTFVVVGEHDRISPPAAMERRVAALRRLGTPVEYRRYPGVGHGFGVGTGTRAEGWVDEAIRFWETTLPAAAQPR